MNRLTLAGIIGCAWLTLHGFGRRLGGTGLQSSPPAYGSVPCIVYRDSTGRWDAMRISPAGVFNSFVPIGAGSEAEAIAWALAQHG